MEKDRLHLTVVSPEKKLFEGMVRYVEIPGTRGLFSVLPGHAPLISPVGCGVLKFKGGDETHTIQVQQGFVEVFNDTVNICIESMEES